MKRSWVQLTVFYLLVTAVSGVFMRSMALFSMPIIPYSNLLHAHSHLALLGWVYMALFLLFLQTFINNTEKNSKQIKWLYRLTQFTIIGIFISFTLQGYALFSIVFSTLQLLLSYWFAVWAWRRMKCTTEEFKPVSTWFAKGSLVCLVVSSTGPWLLAYLSANDLKEIPLYDAAIYFYLHFQYNGWFTLGLVAILLRVLEKRGIHLSGKRLKLVFKMYTLSLLPSFLLSVLWIDPGIGWYIVAAIAAVFQWLALILFGLLLYQRRSDMKQVFEGWTRIFLLLSLLILWIKGALELGSAIPSLSDLIYESRSVVIGYLHLTLLGFVSCLCLSLFLYFGWLDGSKKGAGIGFAAFLFGLGVNELVLFLQGLFDWMGLGTLPYGEEWLWIASIGMAAGIVMFWIKGRSPRIMKL